jgi:hypothetical protein
MHADEQQSKVQLGAVNDRIDLISFLLKMLAAWTARLHSCSAYVRERPADEIFSHSLMTSRDSSHHVFNVSFDHNFTHFTHFTAFPLPIAS